jgi:hypothetical protein
VNCHTHNTADNWMPVFSTEFTQSIRHHIPKVV